MRNKIITVILISLILTCFASAGEYQYHEENGIDISLMEQKLEEYREMNNNPEDELYADSVDFNKAYFLSPIENVKASQVAVGTHLSELTTKEIPHKLVVPFVNKKGLEGEISFNVNGASDIVFSGSSVRVDESSGYIFNPDDAVKVISEAYGEESLNSLVFYKYYFYNITLADFYVGDQEYVVPFNENSFEIDGISWNTPQTPDEFMAQLGKNDAGSETEDSTKNSGAGVSASKAEAGTKDKKEDQKSKMPLIAGALVVVIAVAAVVIIVKKKQPQE